MQRENIGWGTLGRGLRNGLETIWELSKVVLPVYVVLTVLEASPVLGWIGERCEPLMGLFSLSGSCAMVLLLGYVLDYYAAIGAIASLGLSIREITILAVMLSIGHSLILETAVAKKMGMSVTKACLIRLGASLFAGFLVSRLI
jgi:hypothetical protein